jgi:hypothetical protein
VSKSLGKLAWATIAIQLLASTGFINVDILRINAVKYILDQHRNQCKAPSLYSISPYKSTSSLI